MKHELLEDDDEDTMIPDGGRVKVPLYLCDATQRAIFDAYAHQPGYRMSDAAAVRDARREAREARQAWIKQLNDAWRTPVSVRDMRGTPAIKDAPEPDNSSQGERLRRHLRTEESDEAQARRDASWRAYCDQLGRAWQNPGAANAVERQRERWTAER
jgi:hypothetical protein